MFGYGRSRVLRAGNEEETMTKPRHQGHRAMHEAGSATVGALPSTVLAAPTPLIGRARELETIRAHLLRVCAGGREPRPRRSRRDPARAIVTRNTICLITFGYLRFSKDAAWW